ncbi:MAG: hypothetical protein ACRD2L_02280 [Terriglobia bacterium]
MADSVWLMVNTKSGWLSEPAFVILMSIDPEPCHGFTVKNAKRTIAQRHSNRPYPLLLIHTLEMQGRVKRSVSPEEKLLTRCFLGRLGKESMGIPEAVEGLAGC